MPVHSTLAWTLDVARAYFAIIEDKSVEIFNLDLINAWLMAMRWHEEYKEENERGKG